MTTRTYTQRGTVGRMTEWSEHTCGLCAEPLVWSRDGRTLTCLWCLAEYCPRPAPAPATNARSAHTGGGGERTSGGTHPAGAYLIAALTNILMSKTDFHVAADDFSFQSPLGDSDTVMDFITSNNMRLRTAFNNASDSSIGTSYVPGSAPAQMTFVAPPSGDVTIVINAQMDLSATVNSRFLFLSFEIREGASIGSGSVFQPPSNSHCAVVGTDKGRVLATPSCTRTLGGLTPGDTYNIRTHHRVSSTGGVTNAAVSNISLSVRPEM